MTGIVPPRHPSVWKRPDVQSMSDVEYVQWAAGVCMLLPENAFIDDQHSWTPASATATWSNDRGLWRIDLCAHLNTPVILQRLYSSGDQDNQRVWSIDDPHPDHIRSLLQVLGAIEVEA